MFITPHKKLNKRGFTLVELTMVMAITAIISVMIVSFSTLISAQTRKNNLRADFLESVITLRTDLQKQFAEDDNGSSISISADNKTLKIGNSDFSFPWEEYEYIDEHEFDINGKIIKVTLTNKKLSESQSFTLISKVE
ncbi:MAG: prepilin-type N-terminal cleavage/methylation domain-containing protein [Clostridiales bacterium]|nr:prepilin-type N-terminal cleavage/methylation domain-containing protein [Clostridiales bacterium]